MPNETRTYRRSELYEQVWAEPVREVAKRYGVSDVALAKTCRKLAVPLPGVGYWAKKRAGGAVRRTPLPPLPEGVPEEMKVEVRGNSGWESVELSPEASAAVAQLHSPEAAIAVPNQLTDPCQLVVETRRHFRGTASGNKTTNRRLSIWVTPESRDRGLRIFDALIKALEQRGVPVDVTDPYQFDSCGNRLPYPPGQTPNATQARFMDQWLPFRLTENTRGGLEFKILDESYHPGRTEWRDGKRLRLEDQLNAIIAGMYVRAEVVKQMNARYERARREREEEERKRLAAERLAQEEERRAKEFDEMLARWRFARDIREFCAVAKQLVRDSECHLLRGGGLHEQIVWGLAYADKIDPLRSVEEELAGHLRRRRTKAMLGALYTPPFPEG